MVDTPTTEDVIAMFTTTHTVAELAAQHRAQLLADAEAERLARTARAATAVPEPESRAPAQRWWRRVTAPA